MAHSLEGRIVFRVIELLSGLQIGKLNDGYARPFAFKF